MEGDKKSLSTFVYPAVSTEGEKYAQELAREFSNEIRASKKYFKGLKELPKEKQKKEISKKLKELFGLLRFEKDMDVGTGGPFEDWASRYCEEILHDLEKKELNIEEVLPGLIVSISKSVVALLRGKIEPTSSLQITADLAQAENERVGIEKGIEEKPGL